MWWHYSEIIVFDTCFSVYDVYKMKDIMWFSIAYHQHQEYDNF